MDGRLIVNGAPVIVTQRVCDECYELTERDELIEWDFGIWLCADCHEQWTARYEKYVEEVRGEAQ